MEKVLIITYYWPPAGGPGVQRWLKFVKYLRDYGIEPVVYVPENPHYPLLDEGLSVEIPRNLEIIRKPIFEPYSIASLFSKKDTEKISSGLIPDEEKQGLLQKMMLYIRGNYFVPDARKFWVKPSVEFLLEYLEDNTIRTVITTGPPHSLHLIGMGLKEELDIRWIADFRDPWTSIGYHDQLKLTSTTKEIHKEMESRLLKAADQIITTSFTTKREFKEITTTPITVITNGYDVEKIDRPSLDEHFSISHIGSLLAGRNPQNLWKALAELISENEDFRNDFRLKLVGAVGEGVLESIKSAGLEASLELCGYVSHKRALEMQQASQLLLLIEIDSVETTGIIPGKLFEYMAANRPIVAVGPANADIQKIITETNTGKFFGYSEKNEVKEFILSSYNSFKQGELKTYPIGLQKYSRKALTGELAKLLK